jgi:hypothetical protein
LKFGVPHFLGQAKQAKIAIQSLIAAFFSTSKLSDLKPAAGKSGKRTAY